MAPCACKDAMSLLGCQRVCRRRPKSAPCCVTCASTTPRQCLHAASRATRCRSHSRKGNYLATSAASETQSHGRRADAPPRSCYGRVQQYTSRKAENPWTEYFILRNWIEFTSHARPHAAGSISPSRLDSLLACQASGIPYWQAGAAPSASTESSSCAARG